MSLRFRLFLLVAALTVLLVAGQTLLVRSLAARLDRDVQVVAAHVGEEILSGFVFSTGAETLPASPPGEPRHRVVLPPRGEAPGAPAPDAGTPGAPAPDAGTPGEHRWVFEREWSETARTDSTERRIEVRVLRGTTALPPEGAAAPELEPGERDAVLFLKGPTLERRIRIPGAPVASTLDRFGSELALGSLALLGFGLVAAAVVAHRVTRPLTALAGAARRLGAGELGVEVPVARRDEVGAAVVAFNAMSARLAALDRENRRLAESERLSELGEVARGLAHTLRNPLNALGLSLEELAAGRDAERSAALAESSRRQIRRIDGALRSFLALASAPAAAPERFDLAALAREVALEATQDAGGRVRIAVEAPAPVALDGVPAEVRAIVQALVVNACEASPAGGLVRVTVAATAGGGRVTIEDEGAGVPESVRERLFAPHVSTKPQGSGMGLFLARRLAAGRYGGTVELAPRPAGGVAATALLGARTEGGA